MRTTKKTITRLTLLTLVGACDPNGEQLLCPPETRPMGDECVSEDEVSALDDSEREVNGSDTGQNPPAPGVHDATVTPDHNGNPDSGVTQTAEDAGMKPRVCIDTDIPDAEFDDSNCDGIDGDKKLAVFVSPAGNDEASGTEDAPFATLQKAIRFASEQKKPQVLIAAGNYASSLPVFLAPQVSLYGGYDAETWERSVDNETIIAGASTAMLGVVATADTVGGAGEPITLSMLTIQASDAVATGGSSVALMLAGEFAQGTRLSVRIEDCEILAGRGGDGKDSALPTTEASRGNDGLQGALGRGYYIYQNTCSSKTEDPNRALGTRLGGTVPTCRISPVPGAGGDGGKAGYWIPGNGMTMPPLASGGSSGGEGGASGGSVGHNGSSGADGTAGNDGAGGAQVGTFGSFYTSANGQAGSSGAPGQAGGGGGGTNGCYSAGRTCGWVSGATGGGGGSGGCGGEGGTGGQGGGLSAGIIARTAIVTLVRTHVISAQGGRGGRGAAGLSGAEGGKGAPGGHASSLCPGGLPGGRGGDGGRGGRGGTGGGGGGGPSIAVVLAAQAEINADSSDYELTNGQGGAGGAGVDPATSGQPGLATSIYQPR